MEKPVKVLYFVDRMLRGGIQSLVVDWVSRFDKNKIHVDFLLLDDGVKYELEDTLKNLGCNVYKLSNIWIRNPLDFFKEAKALDVFFKEHYDYKVVHMHSSSKNYMVLKYAKKYGIPIRIAHSHSIDFQTKSNVKKKLGGLLKLLLIRYSTHFFACSKKAGEWLFGSKIVNSDKFNLIHNAIDYDKFKFNEKIRNGIRKEFGFSKNDVVIGNVGRFIVQKNHTFLVEIFEQLYQINHNYKLLLVGVGELENEILDKVKSLKIENNVIFAGFRTDVNKLMNAMDIFLLPSLCEGLPVVAIEAQANGLPCYMSKKVITEEVKITNHVIFIPLNKSSCEWAKIISNDNIKRYNSFNYIKKNGYIVNDVVEQLEDIYTNKIIKIEK